MTASSAMIALSSPTRPSPAAIQAALVKQWTTLPRAEVVEEKDTAISLRLGSTNVAIELIPAPIPWSDLKGRLAVSVQWKESADVLLPHAAHVVVTVTGEDPPLASDALRGRFEQMRVLTQVTAAILAAADDAVGVFWTHAAKVFRVPLFLTLATDALPESPPLDLWVAISVGKSVESAKIVGFTHGMESLGHMEFECKNSPEPADELEKRFYGLAKYVLETGAVIRDEDTIGEDADERIKVTYEESSFGSTNKVMRLNYANAKTKSLLARMTLYGYVSLVLTIAVTIGAGFALHSALSGWLGPILRHLLFDVPLLVAGIIFLGVADNIQRSIFGLEAFEDE